MNINISCIDCIVGMKELADNSVDSVVTDPPYEIAFMGKEFDKTGIAFSTDLWKEVFRVLKPGGHLLSFGATRTHHRMFCAIEDAGFEIRDCLMWLYGSGFPKSMDISKQIDDVDQTKQWSGWGTALKPAVEPIVLARKPIAEKTVAANVLKYGTGAINIDACRVGIEERHNPSAKQNKVYGQFKGKESEGRSCSGRFPANLILDEQAGALLDEQSGITRGCSSPSTAKCKSIYRENQNLYQKQGPIYPESGGASRFFYCPKVSQSERNEGLDSFDAKTTSDGRNKPIDNAFQRGETKRKNIHPTVKPIALMEYLIKLITPESGTVLDPFLGSGSTGIAAVNLDRNFIGFELDNEYFKIAQTRLKYYQNKGEEKLINFFE